ncbi:MAG TPA: HIT domain-containing protein [Candidatus Saccharimonadales bacterium]|nr:HIT domain-containing protein [Candidatus Saccharimonadales bacterium]
MFRFPEHQQAYNDYLASAQGKTCPFCDPADETRTVYHEATHALVIQNIFPFDIWEGYKVTDHLLVIPRRHASSLRQLNDAERKDMVDIYAQYESEGYNIYSRAPQSGARSYPHVHTHLIKVTGEPAQTVNYTRAPHNLVVS